MWPWLLYSDAGLTTRASVGIGILIALAIWDARKNGRGATRWKEYLFLLACTVAAMVYGAINDQITSRISWEYFYYGKELYKVLGMPLDTVRLHYEAAKVGMKATWSVGIVVGVVLLSANNPWRGWPRLRYRRLAAGLAIIFGITLVFAVTFGIAGYSGMTALTGNALEAKAWDEARRYDCVFGVHLGGYVGGLTGCGLAAWWVIRQRRKLRNTMLDASPTFPGTVATKITE